MRKATLVAILFLIAGMLFALPATAGGWATITLHHLPQQVRADEPVEIAFTVRQHGQRPINGLSPTIHASSAGSSLTFEAEQGEKPGVYHATLVFPDPGVWEWKVSAFIDGPMPPLTVRPAATAWTPHLEQFLVLFSTEDPAASSISAKYGRDLFIAKGCTACHLHADALGTFNTGIGPVLTDYEPTLTFMQTWLRNAETLTADRQWSMPTLELTDEEIEALTLFLAEENGLPREASR